MKTIDLLVSISPPADGVGWIARVEAPGLPGKGFGVAEAETVAEAFNNAAIFALANGYEPEENHVS